MEELHQGHRGIEQMKALARSYVWWPGLDEDIASMVKGCTDCQSVHNQPAKAPLHPWVWPTCPWECIHVDFLGPFQVYKVQSIIKVHGATPVVTCGVIL